MSKKLTLDLILQKTNTNQPKNIRILNLWGNSLSEISILSNFPFLEKINLDSNLIEDISALNNLKNIKELSLKDNKINDINQIENLKNCKKLEKLSLINNPITTSMNYFQKIIETLPNLKEIDNLETKKIKLKNNNFNSPLPIKENKINNNEININNNIISPESSINNVGYKSSGSDSVSSDRKSEGRNDSAAPDPKGSLIDDLDSNININQVLNINNELKALNKINNNIINSKKEKDKTDILNVSFKKKKTEGSFRKIEKKNIFNNLKEEAKIKHVVNNEINENIDKMSKTSTADFYKNPQKKFKDLLLNEGGYKKKKIENFKKEHEPKGSNIINQKASNSVFKQYSFFDNDKNEFEEEKKKNSYTPKKKKILPKYNKLRPLITTSKKNENNEDKNEINNSSDKANNENKDKNIEVKKIKNEIIEKKEKKENNINKSIIESIKLLASTLSIDGLKQIQKDVQKLLEDKTKNKN